jgi:WD40 repeat protein
MRSLEQAPTIPKEILQRACRLLEERVRDGAAAASEEVLQAYPALTKQTDAVLELLYTEYVLREERGECPPPEEWLARFPQWRQDLALLFQVHSLAAAPSSSHRHSTLTISDRTLASHTASPGDQLPARRVGDHELLEELGRGGMGVVYKARQVSLNRLVAIKMIWGGASFDSCERARLRAEAEAVARLQHPNVVQVHEVGTHEGSLYLALEFVEGGTLSRKLAGVPLPPREAAELLLLLSQAMHHAHERGVLHRDLKPTNVLLTPDGIPKIADFGLAKCVDDHSGLTQSGVIVGTPSYMAPEQAAGMSRAVGPGADIYSLGAILYESLTGRPPFLGTGAIDTLQLVQQEEPVAPSQLRPKLPRDLETICLHCLRKDPQSRYATCADLAADLGRFLAGEPIRARPLGAPERAWRWCRRNPVVASLSAALGLVTLCALALVTWKWLAADAQKTLAVNETAAKEKALAQEAGERRRADRQAYQLSLHLAGREWRDGSAARAEELLDGGPADLRGWEWHYLKRWCNPDSVRLARKLDARTLAYSPDGRYLAGSGIEGVFLWDQNSAAAPRCIQSGFVAYTKLRFSGSNRWLCAVGPKSLAVSGAIRPNVVIWDTQTGKETPGLPLEFELADFAFYRQGFALAYADKQGTIRRFDTVELRNIFTPYAHGAPLSHLLYSPNGIWLAAAGKDRRVKIWNDETRQLAGNFKVERELLDACFSLDSRLLACLTGDCLVKLWDVKSGALLKEFPVGSERGPSGAQIGFSADHRRMFVATGSVLQVWDLQSLRQLAIMQEKGTHIQQFAVRPDGQELALACSDGSLRIRHLQMQMASKTLPAEKGWGRGAVVSADGRRTARWELGWKGVLVRDAQTGRPVSTCRFQYPPELSDNPVSPAPTKRLQLMQVSRFERLLAMSADGRRTAAASPNEPAFVWDSETGATVAVLGGRQGKMDKVEFSPDGRQVATCNGDGSVALWATESGAQQVAFITGYYSFAKPAFTPDGRFLLCGNGSAIRLFDLEKRTELPGFRGHATDVIALAFHPEGKRCASLGRDMVIKIWDVDTGQELLALDAPRGLGLLRFSPDGHVLLAQSDTDGTYSVWDGTPLP